MSHTWINGQLFHNEQAQVHALTHSLHYSGAVFEGIKVYNKKAFRLEQHLTRLLDSAKLLGYEVAFSLSELQAATELVIKETGLSECYVRPLIYRGHESIGIYDSKLKTNVMISAVALSKVLKPQDNSLIISSWVRPAPNAFPPQCKASSGYGIGTVALKNAMEAGVDDALLLGWQGYVAETTRCNVFFVKDKKLITPIPDCFLNGITRQIIIGIASSLELEVIERNINASELPTFDECFLTGTAAEVKLVNKIILDNAEAHYSQYTVGSMLQEHYRKLINSECQ